MTGEKKPTIPYSIEAEQAVLGAILLSNEVFHTVRALVTADDFFRLDHQILFRQMALMIGKGRACDLVTMTEALRQSEDLENVGGFVYVASLANDSWNFSNAEEHAKQIRDCSQRRQIMSFSGDLYEQALRNSADDASAFMVSKVNGLLSNGAAKSKRFAEAVTSACDLMAEAGKKYAAGGTLGAATGLPSFDKLVGGFYGPRLYVVAARAKCGKSAFLNQFAVGAACNGHGGLIVTRELGSDELAIRAMANIADVNVTRLHRGFKEEAKKGGDLATNLGDIPLWIDDETSSIEGICAQIAMHKFRHKIEWAAVDHIGLCRTEQKFGTRDQQLGYITWSLKETAKRLKIPVIALCQLNRLSDKENRRPGVHDLRDSGNIEQDADMVIMLHVALEDRDKSPRPVQIGVPANRTGPSAWLDAPFWFHGETQTFSERLS